MMCFVLVDRDGRFGRTYALSNGMLTLLQHTAVTLPVSGDASASEIIEEYERKIRPSVEFPYQIIEKELLVGKYFPSIARPLYSVGGTSELLNPGWDNEIASIKNTWRELEMLVQDLERCFNVNSPFVNNWNAYGTGYERIIYVACIGVEGLFRKILEDNKLTSPSRDPNMKQFAKLNSHLHLDQYALTLLNYPWLPTISPFEGWNIDKPSKSLHWYKSYNDLKHNKRKSEHAASMTNAIYAIAAYYIVSYAVFGGKLFPGYLSDKYYFEFFARPSWDVTEYYFKPDAGGWSSTPLEL
jgi:hypothetical protein